MSIALLTTALCVSTLPAATAAPPSSSDELEATIADMSLEQKVGQLFVPYVDGATASTKAAENRRRFGVDTPAEAVAKFHLGGVIYFAWSGNTDNPTQIAQLSNGLQQANTAAGNPVPLSIATDQETGLVARVGPPATVFPGAMALGAARDTRLTYDTYQITGRELRAIGINTDYAPDADVNVNPANPVIGVRSFSSDPKLVARNVSAAIGGLQDERVTATAKHFPGHGDTGEDSHYELPTITHTREQWEQIDAPPFRAAIKAGVDAIMTAHISFRALEPSGDPATLSRRVLTGVLRDELKVRGVIATDSLRMAGVRKMYSDAEISVRAIEAGADVLLDPELPALQIQAVIDAVRSGRLTEQRIDESVRRILIMKQNRGVLDEPLVDVGRVGSVVGKSSHRSWAQEITDHTTTLVTDDAQLVPLPSRRTFVTGWGTTQVPQLASGLAERGWSTSSLVTGATPTAAKIADAVAASAGAEQIVVATSAAWKDSGQRDLVAALLGTGKPVLVVALRDPYDIAHLDGVGSYLATYSSTTVAVESALRVITGEKRARGKLPVDILDPDSPATVLYPFGTGLRK
ncbi:MAG TPA: glycoside hydrolase family 3 N-terminal domain-containing protein [Microlunatus sp.]|nr:glycoside hydrolase family 3 N-terminal domain-containing protein [Microlunatus sp.]